MKNIFLIILLVLASNFKAQLYFPPLTGDTWETTSISELGWCQENVDSLYAFLDQTNSKAFIFLKDGKIVLEKYFGTFTKDSLYVWNSAGKTLTGLAIGIAQEQGFLNISDTTSNYLGQGWTSLSPEQEEKITIRHQLTMTTGLNHTGDHFCTDPDCLVYIAAPGERWMYHNGPYTLLDGVITNATGVNLNAFVNQNIRSKIGMNGFYFQIGYNNINFSNARSMARFGLLLLNRGDWNGTAVLSDQNYFDQMLNSSQTLNPSYGYLTWLNGKGSYMLPSPDVQYTINENALPNAPLDLFAAIGKDGQLINVSPSEKTIMIRMGEDDGNSLVSNQYNDTIWQKINALACNNSISNLEKNEFSVYPNPVSDFLYAKNFINGEKVEVVTVLGQTYFLEIKNNKLDLSFLNKGVYFLKTEADIFVKFIKQ